MKKVKLLLEPAEVKMIRDALQVCYDEGDLSDEEMLEGLCQVFGILAMSGNFVKVKVDENTCYADECDCIGNCDCNNTTSDEDLEADECQCDECRADRGLPPLGEGCDGDPENDEPNRLQCWDTGEDNDVDPDAVNPDEDDDMLDPFCDECSCSESDCECDNNDDGFCGECGCHECECDDSEYDDNGNHVGCGVTYSDLEKAWNAKEPWNTDKK